MESKAVQELLRLTDGLNVTRQAADVVIAELDSYRRQSNIRLIELKACQEQIAAVTAEKDRKIGELAGELAIANSERDTAQAACAEMRKTFEALKECCVRDSRSCCCMMKVDRALSTDCGRGFVPVSELEPLINRLKNGGHGKLSPHERCPTCEILWELEALKGGKGE